ncbi:MAG: carbohydrate-binding family 9-like protein [Candidatus Latescibacterota bacterium]|nr:carbohydrate-binding family 9-like protein [Candidatus Latescibacterota bacterium]
MSDSQGCRGDAFRALLERLPWVLGVCLAVALPAAAAELPDRVQEPPDLLPSYPIQRVSADISIDGLADEADWRVAGAVELVVPWRHDVEEPIQQTTVRMLWSATELYIVYKCVDPFIRAEIVEHDGATYLEDTVEIFATPNPDDVWKYYGYEMNVRGTLLDYITFWRDGKRLSGGRGWQSEGVRIATTIDGTLNDDSDRDRGWILEIAIPFDNFRHLGGTIPPRPGDRWRLNLNRCAGKVAGQYAMWSDSGTEQPQFHVPERFGIARFSADVVGNGAERP